MENPATWGEAERVVAQALKEHHEAMVAGIVGRSDVKAITDALKKARLLKE